MSNLTVMFDTAISKKTILTQITYDTSNKYVKIEEQYTNNTLKHITLKNTFNKEYIPVILNKDFDVMLLKDFMHIRNFIVKLETIEDLNKGTLYFIYYSGNLLFDSNMKIVSTPHTFTYISSLKQRHTSDIIFNDLIQELSKHEYVKRLEVTAVEYFSADFEWQQGIDYCTVYIPQKKYEKLYNFYKNEDYFSSKMHNIMELSYLSQDFNLYGKKIQNLLKKYWSK